MYIPQAKYPAKPKFHNQRIKNLICSGRASEMLITKFNLDIVLFAESMNAVAMNKI